LDYREIKIKPNSVIYCDPPYVGTAAYDGGFDHDAFYDWVESQDSPVFISEYTMPKNRNLFLISTFRKRSLLSAKKDNKLVKTEKVFGNKAAFSAIKKKIKMDGIK